jgi:HEAT repeat protein
MGLLSWLTGSKNKESDSASAPDADAAGSASDPAGATAVAGAIESGSTAQDDESTPGIPLESLRDALSSRDGARRVDAARALLERWRSGDGGAAQALAPQLDQLLQDGEPQVRVTALSATRLLRKPENQEKVTPHVVALLADDAAQVRTAAIWAAAKLPGQVARTQVKAVLSSEEEPMRFAAACALADLKDSSSLAVLTASLDEEFRRQEALSALLALGDKDALPAVAALFEEERLGQFDRTLTAAVLARLGDPRGEAHLIERIDESGDDRPIAAEWAGRLGLQGAAEALTALAQEEGDPARGAALRALGRLKAPGAAVRLLELAGDPQQAEDLRMDAAEGLAELGSAEATSLLEKLARSTDAELAQLCKELLAELAALESSGAQG